MHIQFVTFRLKDMPPGDYVALCDELAPTFAAIPGLLAETWLASPETGVYGAVYSWRDPAAMEAANVFAIVQGNPNFTEGTSRQFDILEGPTRITRGLIAAAV